MRLVITLLFLFAGVLSLPSIASSYILDTSPNANRNSVSRSRVIAQRQHRIRRAEVDICISITSTTFLSQERIVNAALENIQICVCLSNLDIWLDINIDAKRLTRVLGRPRVKQILQTIFTGGVDSRECILPTHAHHICRSGDPCAFECQDNYTEEDGECACLLPFQDCNGICGAFPNGCGTAAPVSTRHKRRSIPITTLVQAKHTCNIYESVCGIPGREDTLDFECVDTRETLDSCGGCLAPHPFYESYPTTVRGVECGRLPGVISASCSNSRCVVSHCREGLQPSADKTVCVSGSSNLHQLVVGGFGSRPIKQHQESVFRV